MWNWQAQPHGGALIGKRENCPSLMHCGIEKYKIGDVKYKIGDVTYSKRPLLIMGKAQLHLRVPAHYCSFLIAVTLMWLHKLPFYPSSLFPIISIIDLLQFVVILSCTTKFIPEALHDVMIDVLELINVSTSTLLRYGYIHSDIASTLI